MFAKALKFHNFIDSKILYGPREAYCETNPEVQYLKHTMHVIMLGHEGRHVSLCRTTRNLAHAREYHGDVATLHVQMTIMCKFEHCYLTHHIMCSQICQV